MGIKIILTEEQLSKLEGKVGRLPINEGKANLACRYIDFESLDEELNSRDKKKIGYETSIERIDDLTIGIKHHYTHILKVDPTNVITVNNGGHYSPTTKDRLNQFLSCKGVHIYQKKGEWFIVGDNGTFEYENGVEVHANGYIVLPSGRRQAKDKGTLEIDPALRALYGLEGPKSSSLDS